jgi:hypothetical protein
MDLRESQTNLLTINVPVVYMGRDILIGFGEIHTEGPPLQTAQEKDFPTSKSICPAPNKKTGT